MIDIDCVESDRPKIFEHIIKRFGADKTARVASFGTSQEKGVIDDVGRHLAKKWNDEHPNQIESNPWSLKNIAKIKDQFDTDPEATKKKYKELFYYFDGLLGTKVSQSVHPAGIVISPITLPDNYGTFEKDGETCLLLDMDNIHDYTGLVKYDMLLLKTVQVIRDTCRYLHKPYPRMHEIDWNDQKVWSNMIISPVAEFQMEGSYAFSCMQKFAPKSIFDLSLVTAAIRPSGASYRDDLLARKVHKNPSPMIDELLKDNLGFLVYQEDTIKFLQQICGLSGSDADNIRRSIGRKQKDRLDAAMPSILEGYCNKSPQPREVAEREAKEFLQVIEDSASYQFGYNHSIAYCMLTYLCAYYRYYHPLEFITAFLNDAANDDDIKNGTNYAMKVGIMVTNPKYGFSRSEYFYDKERNIIAKGLESVKYMNNTVAEDLYSIAHDQKPTSFIDVLKAIDKTAINSRQLDILIKLDFFSEFGNQRELSYITDIYANLFKKGNAKQIQKEKIDGTPLEEIVKRHSNGKTKSGQESKSYILQDVDAILAEAEKSVLDLHMEDYDSVIRARNFAETMGYAGYVSGVEEDRSKLYVQDVHPLRRKKDGKQFGYGVKTKSIGSGIESTFTVDTRLFREIPIEKGDVIWCTGYERVKGYFHLYNYVKYPW